MIRKKILKLILGTLTATMLLGMPVLAEESSPDKGKVEIQEENTREEEFIWIYRTYNGRRQRRLWSLTYQYWVTDWIDVDPA
ncbi:MAG: hypothetical protein E7295_08805 [Lachnospiraceae bacterium]|jgi:hypothetical protein|nr:hypothetical protein [Lachnospiraceae bacterium]